MIEFDAVIHAPAHLSARVQADGRVGVGWGIGIKTNADVITEMVYVPSSVPAQTPAKSNKLVVEAVTQFKRYFKSPEMRFDLPLAARGSDFQQRVWGVIASLKAGELLSYGEVAKRIQSAPRAVGQACGANWYPLVIPCHRVVAAGQRGYALGGFAHHADQDGGFHAQVKRALLAHEGVKL